jgi:hypothetical protein
VFEPVWRSSTTHKQPVNLAVEGAEESLTILPVLHTHRTSPAQALLTIWIETSGNVRPALALPPSCVWCPMCTIGSLRTERGWVTAVDGVPQRLDLGGNTVQ